MKVKVTLDVDVPDCFDPQSVKTYFEILLMQKIQMFVLNDGGVRKVEVEEVK